MLLSKVLKIILSQAPTNLSKIHSENPSTESGENFCCHVSIKYPLWSSIFYWKQNLLGKLFDENNVCRRSHTARVHEKKRLQFSDSAPLIPENDVTDSCLPERRVLAEDGSLVRCLHFACTFIEDTSSTCPTLWVGTNSGLVLALSLAIPNTMETRQSDGIIAGRLSEKEIKTINHRYH